MAYIAQKVTNLSGRDFLIGEIIPEECIVPERVPDLIKMGIIAESAEGQVTFPINYETSEGQVILDMTEDELNQCFSVLMGSVEDAKKIIAEITSSNVLLLLDASEHRKTVSKILEDRINELSPQEAPQEA